MKYPVAFFADLGNILMNRVRMRHGLSALRLNLYFFHDPRFRAMFGTHPAMCVSLWHMLSPETTMPKGARPIHLLWALMMLKLYCSESVLSSIAGGVTEKTFRKWAWIFIDGIAKLESRVVSCEHVAALLEL